MNTPENTYIYLHETNNELRDEQMVGEHDPIFEVTDALQSQHTCASVYHGHTYPTSQALPYSERAAVVSSTHNFLNCSWMSVQTL
jgi:hypothetical protein